MGGTTVHRTSGIALRAEPRYVREARRFVDRAAAACGFEEAARFDIQLAASEAVSNAIVHGCAGDGRTIRISAVQEDGMLTFSVADSGTFVARVDADDPLSERGRGLACMARVMDEVCIASGEDGTLVRFSKRLP
jgi:anti-sigma regulatory factor (Ser/Thr protein kinase)